MYGPTITMDSATSPLSLPKNGKKKLMLESQATLKKGPAADLMSVFPEFYVNKYRKAHYTRLSWAANINHRLIKKICCPLRHESYLSMPLVI